MVPTCAIQKCEEAGYTSSVESNLSSCGLSHRFIVAGLLIVALIG